MIYPELEHTIPEKYNSWSPKVQQAAQQAWKQLNGNMDDFKIWWGIMSSNKDRLLFSKLNLSAKSYYIVSPSAELLNKFRVYWLTQSYMYHYYIGKLVTIRDFIDCKMGNRVEDEEAGRSGGNIFYFYNHKQNHWYGNQGTFSYGEVLAFITDRNRKKRLTLFLSEVEVPEIRDSKELERIYLDPLTSENTTSVPVSSTTQVQPTENTGNNRAWEN